MAGSVFQDRLSVVQDGSERLSGRFRMAVWFQSDFSLVFQCGFSLAFQCGFSLGFQDVSVLHFMVGESGVELAKHARQTHSPGPTVDDDGERRQAFDFALSDANVAALGGLTTVVGHPTACYRTPDNTPLPVITVPLSV